ncbi:DUF2919 family protein [Halochromatium sp.]
MSLKYQPERYDDHLCLRVPVTLWLCLVFLVRHLLLLGITFLPTTGEEITVLRELIRPEYLLADLLALPVLLVGVRRRPRSPRWMPQLWRIGRGLLLASAALYLLLFGAHLIASTRPLTTTLNEATLITGLLNLAIIAYLIRSPLLRDLFAQWPTEPSPDSP